MTRIYFESDDEGWQVYLFEDGCQVAGVCVPGDNGVDAYAVAWSIGSAFGKPLPSMAIH